MGIFGRGRLLHETQSRLYMRKIGLVAIKEPQCRAGLALQSRTADLQAPMKLSLGCAEGRETIQTRFKLRRLVRFSRLARALFAPLSGCPTRENSRGTAQGSVRAAYENSDSRTRAANGKSHCRVGHFDWTFLLQMFQDRPFQKALTHTRLLTSPRFHAPCCHPRSWDEKRWLGGPEVLSTAWGMGTIKSLISASGAGAVRTVGWGAR